MISISVSVKTVPILVHLTAEVAEERSINVRMLINHVPFQILFVFTNGFTEHALKTATDFEQA